jgi:hypothetical protein
MSSSMEKGVRQSSTPKALDPGLPLGGNSGKREENTPKFPKGFHSVGEGGFTLAIRRGLIR